MEFTQSHIIRVHRTMHSMYLSDRDTSLFVMGQTRLCVVLTLDFVIRSCTKMLFYFKFPLGTSLNNTMVFAYPLGDRSSWTESNTWRRCSCSLTAETLPFLRCHYSVREDRIKSRDRQLESSVRILSRCQYNLFKAGKISRRPQEILYLEKGGSKQECRRDEAIVQLETSAVNVHFVLTKDDLK